MFTKKKKSTTKNKAGLPKKKEKGVKRKQLFFNAASARPTSRLWQEVFHFQRSLCASPQEMSTKIGLGGEFKRINKYINKSANQPSEAAECQSTGGEEPPSPDAHCVKGPLLC